MAGVEPRRPARYPARRHPARQYPRRRQRCAQSPQSDRARAALALAIAPGGFTVAEFTAKVRELTGQAGYTIRKAACDLRKLLGKHLAGEPRASAGTSSRPVPPA